MSEENRRYALAERPEGLIDDNTFTLETNPVPEIGEGEALVKVKWISIDPTNRTWIGEEPTYLPPVQIGETMRALGLGEVVASNNGNYPVGSLVRLVVQDEFAQRDRFLRDNLDVLARKVGEMQAKLTQLESLGERVSGLAGVNPAEIKARPGQGGALVTGRPLTMEELQATLADLGRVTDQRTDLLTVLESRLFDQKMRDMMVPTQKPVALGNLGSAFGWRVDPITGHSALHTGLDFQADPGTPIIAAGNGIFIQTPQDRKSVV